MYRKPGTNFEEFKQEFEFVLQNLNLDKKLTIIMGDFNVDLTSDEEKSRELIRLTESYGLVQLIKTATRVTNTSSTLIDHIYTNISSYCIKSGCIEAGISDHLPTYALLENFDFKPAKKVVRRLRNFRNYSKDSFCDDLSTAQWKEIYKCTDPDEAYELFYTIFLEVCNKHAPVQEVSFNSKKRNNPWITKSIKKSIRKKHVLYSKTIKSGHDKAHVDKFKKYRNILTSVIRTAKKLYYGKLFQKEKNNGKKTWNLINELLNKTPSQNNTKIDELIRKENDGSEVRVNSSTDIANTFNDFFL